MAISQCSTLSAEPLVRMRDVRFSHNGGQTWVLDGIDLSITPGERLCIIGPNGAGKSTLVRLIAGLSAPDEGEITLLGHQVFHESTPDADQYRAARRDIGVVFQNPADQLITTVTADDTAFGPENLNMPRTTIGTRVDESLRAVEMSDFRAADPTRLSGGQQQRVTMAGALAMSPRLLVLDEPTAMLDEEAQADVLHILERLHDNGTTIVHVTHKPAELQGADRVLELRDGLLHDVTASSATAMDGVGDAGTVCTDAETDLTTAPTAASSAGLDAAAGNDPVISVEHVSLRYPNAQRDALHDVTMHIDAGEIIAIMGRNGTGKTTLTRVLTALSAPDTGTVRVAGLDMRHLSRADKRTLRRTVGLVMQQPERQLFADTVLQDVAYGPRNQGLTQEDAERQAQEALDMLGMGALTDRSPFALSGGQQRLVAIAGIIACHPRVLIMDEPSAGLDSTAAARIDQLILSLHAQGVTVVLITHAKEQAARLGARIIKLRGERELAAQPASTRHAAPQPDSAPASNTAAASHRSFIASLDPRVKLVLFLVLLFTGFTVATPAQLLLSTAAVAAIIGAARINPLKLLGSLKLFLGMFAILGIVNMFFVQGGRTFFSWGPLAITEAGLADAVLYSCRLALVVIIGAVLLRTTTPTELTDGFASLLSPLSHWGLHTQEIALVMSLALRFLPTLAQEARSIVDAQSARGGSIETGTPAKRIRALAAIIVPVFTGALRHSDNLSLALDARCYEAGMPRTRWHEMKAGRRDWVFGICCTLYVCALLVLGRGAAIMWT